MRDLNKILSLVMAVAVLFACLAMTGCQNQTEEGPTAPAGNETEYKVTVTDADGNALGANAVAVFYKDGQQAGMQVCDETGTAVKTLASDTYTVEIQFTGDAVYYCAQELTVSADSPELTAVLYNTASVYTEYPNTYYDDNGESQTELGTVVLYVTKTEENPDGTEALQVKEGYTYVELTGDVTYFLFVPEQGGTYEFSILDGDGCKIASCGNPNYIRDPFSGDEELEDIYSASIENTAVTGDLESTLRMVMGISNPNGLEGCVVSIQRVGDPAWNVSQEEWIIYETTAELSAYQVPEGTELFNFDLTQSYELVYNEDDGFYHLDSEDGALVYVWLTEDPRFVDCFQTILEEGTVRAYFYDDNGDFIKKEAYGPCLKEYFEVVDTDYGVYPLTQDLAYIIQSYGEHAGWWDVGSNTCMISVDGLNVDSAWLFMCCYAA